MLRALPSPVVGLCHHPLALETGLAPGMAERLRRSERAALAACRHVVTTSAVTAATLAAEYGVAPGRLTVAPPGTDPAARAIGSGVVAGLLGVGGGVLNVPAIRLALKRSMIVAVATSTMIIAFTAGTGAATFVAAGYMKWPLATGCATGAFVGGRLGAWLAPRIPRKALTTIFIGVLLYVAIEFAVRGFGLPWWR